MSQLRFDDSAPRPIETSRGFRLDKAGGKVMARAAGHSAGGLKFCV